MSAPERIAPERIAKVIARAGLCSRRDAEKLIAEGRVALDGRPVESPATLVGEAAAISVDGRALPEAEPARLWRLNKPAGVIVSARDPQGRRTVFDLLPAGLPRLQPVGRLDLSSEGLLLLTNDGALKRRLEQPEKGYVRRYRVRVYGTVSEAALAALAKGVTVEGVRYGAIAARLDSRRGANAWLTMSLGEGKNREVRRVCEHLGLKVSRLIRISYGPFHLGKLPAGAVEELPRKALREQLGEAPPARRIGHARAKPRPVKPGYRKAAKLAAKPADQAAPEGRGRHAHRRRPA